MEINNKDRIRFVYHYASHTDTFDEGMYTCPNCGGDVFITSKPGNKKIQRNMVKLKCILCNTFTILNKERMERVLGKV